MEKEKNAETEKETSEKKSKIQIESQDYVSINF